jgi:predicted HTH domain antitoxin
MEVTLHIPDDVAKELAAAGGDVPRRALEALALEGYREHTLTVYQVSEMLGFSRVETEDFLGQHQVPLSEFGEADLDRPCLKRRRAAFEALLAAPSEIETYGVGTVLGWMASTSAYRAKSLLLKVRMRLMPWTRIAATNRASWT